MERKIGETFKHNGEWYQCIEIDSCGECSLRMTECGSGTKSNLADEVFGECSKIRRSDSKHVVFKRLEKIGEPFEFEDALIQELKVIDPKHVCDNCFFINKCAFTSLGLRCRTNTSFFVLIKQNKEDMEEKTQLLKEDNPLTRLVYNYVNGKISDKELIKSIKEMSDEYPYNKNNLKPFSLEAAKSGKPVCTRDGRKARIICFDKKGDDMCPIYALVEGDNGEELYAYDKQGRNCYKKCNEDLMMLPEKKEVWVNVYKERCYESKEEAIRHIALGTHYIDTIRVEWEE